MDLMLRNKVAIVTGASKGIGMAVTEALADEGVLVVAAARRVSSLQGLEGVTAIAVDLFDAGAPAADAIESSATVKAARAARRTDLMRRPRREDTVAAASYIIGPSAADDAVRCEGTGKRRGARGSAPGHSHRCQCQTMV